VYPPPQVIYDDSFRELDFAAERGEVFTDPVHRIRYQGTDDASTCPQIAYPPLLELGPYVFCRLPNGQAERVHIDHSSRIMPYIPHPILIGIDDLKEGLTFDLLVHYPPKLMFVLHWKGGYREEIRCEPASLLKIGRVVGAARVFGSDACIRNPTPEPEPEPVVVLAKDDAGDPCTIDPYVIEEWGRYRWA
jgi:hypothetical protein